MTIYYLSSRQSDGSGELVLSNPRSGQMSVWTGPDVAVNFGNGSQAVVANTPSPVTIPADATQMIVEYYGRSGPTLTFPLPTGTFLVGRGSVTLCVNSTYGFGFGVGNLGDPFVTSLVEDGLAPPVVGPFPVSINP